MLAKVTALTSCSTLMELPHVLATVKMCRSLRGRTTSVHLFLKGATGTVLRIVSGGATGLRKDKLHPLLDARLQLATG